MLGIPSKRIISDNFISLLYIVSKINAQFLYFLDVFSKRFRSSIILVIVKLNSISVNDFPQSIIGNQVCSMAVLSVHRAHQHCILDTSINDYPCAMDPNFRHRAHRSLNSIRTIPENPGWEIENTETVWEDGQIPDGR